LGYKVIHFTFPEGDKIYRLEWFIFYSIRENSGVYQRNCHERENAFTGSLREIEHPLQGGTAMGERRR